ncbi:MAG: type VI secretion system secreted protein Hcp [Porticoccaceae bacterium]|jgi:type VI secretion system secreted protein Hcp
MKKSHSLIKRAAWLLLPLCMSVAYTAQAGIDMYLEFLSSNSGDTIQGDSQDTNHKDQIDVLRFSEGMINTFAGDYRYQGGSGGKTNRNALAVTKYLDRSSPALRMALVEGRLLDDAILRVARPTSPDPQPDYFVIELKNVIVTKVSMSASDGDDRLTEEVELTFEKITWTYRNSSMDPEIKAGWDFTQNKEYLN